MALALVAGPDSAGSSGNSLTVSFDAAVASGGTIIVLYGSAGRRGSNLPTSSGLSFTERANTGEGAQVSDDIDTAVSKAISDTIACSQGSNSNGRLGLALAFDGVATYVNSQAQSSTSSDTVSISRTANAGDAAVGFVVSEDATSISTPSGWLKLFETVVDAHRCAAFVIEGVSAGTLTFDPTCTACDRYQAVMSIYTPPAGGGGGEIDLAADHIEAPAPLLANPSVGQSHGLTAMGLAGAPIVGSAGIGQVHSLAVGGITTAPTISAPAVGQVHGLFGDGLSALPTLGSPSMSAEVDLSAQGLAATPLVGAPALGQEHSLTADGISVAVAVGVGALGQRHGLTAADISSAPVLGEPAVTTASTTDDLEADNLIAGTPQIEDADIGQTHALAANDNETTSAFGAPAIGQVHWLEGENLSATLNLTEPSASTISALDAGDIIAGAPDAGTAQIGQAHAIVAVGLSTSPLVAPAILGQVHNIAANDISATPLVGMLVLSSVSDSISVPAFRTVRTAAETRYTASLAEVRSVATEAENRVVIAPNLSRLAA